MSPQLSSTRKGRGRLALVALALLAVLALPAGALAADGSIAGTVTAVAGGGPVPDVEVCVESEAAFECGETEADGTYLIEALPPADYTVEFWPRRTVNLIPEFYDDKGSWGAADPVEVADGADVVGIDAALAQGGWIEGQVVDAGSKAGLEGFFACAFPIDETGFPRCGETAADGTYEILGLATDSYEVGFFSLDEESDYLPQFYDGKPFWFEATPVAVTAGAGVVDIDAQLLKGGTVTGTVTDAISGAGIGFSLVCLRDAFDGELLECEFTGPGGKYAIGGVVPGTYKVWFSPDVPEWELEDDYVQQYWNAKQSFALADPVGVGAGGTVAGIDARLVSRKAPAQALPPPPAAAPPFNAQQKRPVKRCRKGKRRVKRHGKVRCVKAHRKHRR